MPRGVKKGYKQTWVRKVKPFDEKLIQWCISVPGKHLRQAQKEVDEVLKKYRA